ncbi:MAG: proton-conducting transporter membrane subunit [Pseudomonadota bacterium]
MNIAYLLLLAPAPALAGFGFLALAPFPMTRRPAALIGAVAGAAPFFIMLPVLFHCFGGGCDPAKIAPIMTLTFGETDVALALGLDGLSVIAGTTVSGIGALVLLYAVGYMAEERGRDVRRFFALMNLFVAGMLSVTLAADSIVFFLGWEIIGLCSFFLIGYYTDRPRALVGARKAFVMTRIADAALLAALLLLFLEAGSVRLADLIPAGVAMTPERQAMVAALLLVGALGKSAQLPFQTWLPTAMVGPTPVSALLHSATMVAAGAFLLARLAPIFAAAPMVAGVTAAIGLATAIFGAICALAQTDAKQMLAYSSISQIGFMVLALGLGAPGAAMAHFVIHAFFKSLLFLSAGVLSHSAGGSTAIRALAGGSARAPMAFLALAAGAASLAGLPFVTAGWYSKEAVLAAAWDAGVIGKLLWLLSLGAAAVTAAYAARLILAAAAPGAMNAAPNTDDRHSDDLARPSIRAPLVALAILALLGGVLVGPILHLLHEAHHDLAFIAVALGAIAPLLGAWVGYRLHAGGDAWLHTPFMRDARRGGQVDARYQAFVVRPFRRFKNRIARADPFEIRLPMPKVAAAEAEAAPIGGLLRRISRWRRARRPIRIRLPGWRAAEPVARLDLVGQATVSAGTFITRLATRALQPDRIDVAGTGAARAVGGFAEFVRRVQTGRVRDYLFALALGVGVLLLFA